MMAKKYSYLPGVVLIVAASARAALEASWDAPALWMAAAGALVVALSVAWNRRDVVAWLRDPRGVFAVMTGISVVVLVLVLVFVNIAVWYQPWRVDLTASGRNQLTAETASLLERLDVDVTLVQFGRAPDPAVEQLLSAFAATSRRVQVQSVDPERHPDEARRYGVIKLGSVVVTAGDKFRKVEAPHEQSLVTGILQVTGREERTVCFITGHGERGVADETAEGVSIAAATLQAANYAVERISLLEGEVPEQCAVLVIAGPRQTFEASELERLGKLVRMRMAVFVDPAPAIAMAEWLRPFGIVPEDGIVIDTSGAGRSVGGGPDMPIAFSYADHPITSHFEIATMFRRARRLSVIQPEYGGQPRAIARTSERSFATAHATSGEIRFNAATDTRGPLPLAVATTLRAPGQAEEYEVRLVVVGDSDFVSNALVNRQGNRDFFLRIVAWLAGEREATIVSVQSRENRRTELSERARAAMYLVNMGLLPLIPLVAGIIAFVRSKR